MHDARLKYASELKERFGLSPAEFVTMGVSQGWRCAICNRSRLEVRKDLVVDGDPKTGRVQALLCPGCKEGLENFDGDLERLKAASEYLKLRGTSNEI